MGKYVALLRGINVGGNNLIKMVELKACFEKSGLKDVRTYIASGNVIFSSPEADVAKLAKLIEKDLAKTFGYKTWVVVKSAEQMRKIVKDAPKGFGTKPAEYRYDVIFLNPPLTSAETMRNISVREGVDKADAGPGVIYFSRLVARITQSYINKVIGTPLYQNMTIRNWNTTAKLAGLLDTKD